MELSIIIVNWNTKQILQECLRSIYRETHDLTFEIIVVDNASTDGSQAMLDEHFPQIIKRYNHDNLGFAKANNVGLAAATGEYVLFLNSDTVLMDGNPLRQLVDHIREHHFGAVGPRLLNTDGTLQVNAAKLPTLWTCFNEFVLSREVAQYPKRQFSQPFIAEQITGASLMVETALAKALGGFCEKYFMYSEDVDLCLRIHRRGRQIGFLSSAVITHHGGKSSTDKRGLNMMLLRNRINYFKYNYTGLTPWLADLIIRGGLRLHGHQLTSSNQ